MAESACNAFVLQKNLFSDCIDVYPAFEWEKFLNSVREKLNFFNENHNVFYRELCRGCYWAELDSSGRLLLSRKLLSAINVEKEMVLLGVGNKIEIWQSEKYLDSALKNSDLSKLAKEIFK